MIRFTRPLSSWSPLDLGTDLIAWWDAERSDLVTRDGSNLVSSWKDIVAGYDAVQATAASKPLYGVTSFNGRPGVTVDGVDDELTLVPVPAGIPIGAVPCELWALLDQTAPAAESSIRIALGIGGGSTVNRYIARSVSSGNRPLAATGDGTIQKAALGTGDFTGRHVLRAQITGAAIQIDMDGVAGASTACVPATSSTRLRMFGNTSAAAGSAFFQGAMSAALITRPLAAFQAAQLNAYLTQRLAAGPPPNDPDVLLWATAVAANGGTVSGARAALASTMVAAWKTAGIWALIDDAWLLVAENEPQALTSLKQKRLAVAMTTPTFTVDRGYAFGSSSYLDTGFVPGTHAVAMTGTNMHIAAYERTNVASTSAAAGCLNTNSQSLVMQPRRTDGIMGVQLNSLSSGPGGDVSADSRGFSVASRNGTLAADVLAYRNGVAVLPFAPGTLGSALTTSKLYIGCRADATNVAGSFRSATQGFVSVGAAIPAGQQPAFYSALQAFMTSTGANV